MVKLQFDEKQYKLTLPKKLLEAIGWKKGDDVLVEIDLSGSIVLRNRSSTEISSKKGDERIKEEERIEYAR